MLFWFIIPQNFLDILLKKELKKLFNKKALGLDKIANKVLKKVYKELYYGPYKQDSTSTKRGLVLG